MLERILQTVTGDYGTGIYVLWGLGFVGLVLKLFANTYIGRMAKAAHNLGDTKKRKLRIMRQQYENKRSFGLCGGDEGSYAESFVRELKFLTRPMEFWEKSGKVFSLVICGAMAGAFLYYDVSWRGSPYMETFLLNGFLVCVCLLVFENIFLIDNKVEILKANIQGYLERLPDPRLEERREISPIHIERVDLDEEMKKLDSMKQKKEEESIEQGQRESAAAEPDDSSGGEESLNSFLAEFFS